MTMQLRACPACQANVSQAASACPHCGHPFTRRRHGIRNLFLGLVAIAGLLVLAVAFSDEHGNSGSSTAPFGTCESSWDGTQSQFNNGPASKEMVRIVDSSNIQTVESHNDLLSCSADIQLSNTTKHKIYYRYYKRADGKQFRDYSLDSRFQLGSKD